MDPFENDDARLWRLLKEVRETVKDASPMPLDKLFKIAKIEGYVHVHHYESYSREKIQRTIDLARRWADWEELHHPQILNYGHHDSPYEDMWELRGPDPDDAKPCACMRKAEKIGRYAKAEETFRTPLKECRRRWRCWTYWAFAFVKKPSVEVAKAETPLAPPSDLEQIFRDVQVQFASSIPNDGPKSTLFEETAASLFYAGKPIPARMRDELDAQYDKLFRKK